MATGTVASAGRAGQARSSGQSVRKPHPRPARPAAGGPKQLLWLQAMAGNAAVTKLVNSASSSTAPAEMAVSVQRDAGACPAPPVAPPGITAAEDPRFQQVKRDVATKGKVAKAHPAAGAEVDEAQAAAEPPTDDKEAQAKAAHAGEMAQAKPAGFDKAAFIAEVTKAIAAQQPKTNEDAMNFASSGKAGAIKDQVSGMVSQGKDKSAKEIADSSGKPPDPGKAVEKPVTPLSPPKPTPELAAPDARKAIPEKAPAEQTELGGTKCELDQKMADADVSKEQLAESNEPEFTGAVEAKEQAEEHAAAAPAKLRAEERAQLAGDVAGAKTAGAAGIDGMLGANTRAMGQANAAKGATKSKDERERARISGEIKRIFDATKADVDTRLGGLDALVESEFSKGEAHARSVFEADHKRRMKEYEDKQDLLDWIAAKFQPTRPEVLQIFRDAAKTYENEMQKVIGAVADKIGSELDLATERIQKGRDEVAKFVAEQPKELQSIAKEAAENIGGEFDSLDSAVTEKSQSLADDLAQKYTAARAEVDKRVEELQAEHKSWRDKAVDAVEGAIDTVIKLKDMLLGVLARAAGAIDKIIKKPVEFLGNLVSAVKTGVMNFGSNIAEHLKSGLKAWLLGNLASAGIEIPETFDIKGILKMVLSILGLTWTSIRARITKFIPEPVMAKIEQTVEVVQILISEGVPGLWKWIVQKLGDLKEMVLGQIKDFVITKIVKAGIVWIVSLLNPAAAFIKACHGIYNIVMFLVNQGSQIKAFVDSVLDGVEQIASGAGSAVSGLIEKALAKSLPMVIGFLASLLGLGGISDKIKEILQKVQEPVGKVIDSIIGTIVKIGKGLWNKITGKGGDDEKSKAVKKKAQDMLTGPTAARFEKKEDLNKVVGDVLTTLKPEGLKALDAVPDRDKPGRFKILASASPKEKVAEANVEEESLAEMVAKARKQIGSLYFFTDKQVRIRISSVSDEGFVSYEYEPKPDKDPGKALFRVKEFNENIANEGPRLRPKGAETAYTVDGKLLKKEYQGAKGIRPTFYGGFNSAALNHRTMALEEFKEKKRQQSIFTKNPLSKSNEAYVCPGPLHVGKLVPGVGTTVISLDHNPSVSKHWNTEGNSTNQENRKEFYSRIEILDPMCLECNRHIGGEDYTPEVTESFTGPGNKR